MKITEDYLCPEAKEVIDAYMNREDKLYPQVNIYDISTVCIQKLKEMVNEIFMDRPALRAVRLKDKTYPQDEISAKYDHYFDNTRFIRFRSVNLDGRRSEGYETILSVKSEMWILRHSEEIIGKFISEKFVTLERAIWGTYSFLQLCREFQNWFERKREKFMNDMTEAIAEVKKFNVSEKPQSHGGVANLLKVLTRTMEKQGADIENIAKVQYAVCIQAGIYITNEFLSDVAVAAEILEGKE